MMPNHVANDSIKYMCFSCFAEVVFENGDTRVVDFNNRTRTEGTYRLIDFADGRRVDHVHMVARATSEQARIGIWMVK